MRHRPPQYYGYRGGYADVTACMKCHLVGLRQDQHPVHCCPCCGGEVREIGAARWMGTPRYRFLGLVRDGWDSARWELSPETQKRFPELSDS